MTINDIAKLANVSASTVSRAINHPEMNYVGKEVRDRIWKIIEENGFVPNAAARKLKSLNRLDIPTDHNIALIFARSNDTTTDLFFSKLAQAIKSESLQLGYSIKYTFVAAELTKEIMDFFSQNGVIGIAVLGRFNQAFPHFLKSRFKNIISVGLNSIEENVDQVICDGYEAAIKAVTHLKDLGHEKIGYIGETTHEMRFRGYREAMNRYKLQICPKYVINVPLSYQGGYDAGNKIFAMSDRPSAVFCANDDTAIGLIKCANELKISLPDDLSIISIDDIESSQWITPMLTTIHVPLEELGSMATKMLIDRIEKGHCVPIKLMVPFYLVKRESCQKHRTP